MAPTNAPAKYIVVFKDSATPQQIDEYVKEVSKNGGEVTYRYDILNGFAAAIPDHFLASLQASAIIHYIEPDSVVTTQT
ncbi:hypothetical protein NLJ89_g656 [Agrocybe chaxingu]|uniref:Inhibitor I9 domain-containing protein n=1 Tax=Agrocybe chaxingu TaxID=84603 RepID=A0A9W8N1K0_9AGAR|nr:hypothetical protein NLJ89_g656 [Agrocybe chaxingu]